MADHTGGFRSETYGGPWDIFRSYTRRYVKSCFFDIPLILMAMYLAIDYLPRAGDVKFAAAFPAFVYYGFLFPGIAFVLYTMLRAGIAASGSYALHLRTETVWFHGLVMASAAALGVEFSERLQPFLVGREWSFSNLCPNSLVVAPTLVLMLLLYYSYRGRSRQYRDLRVEAQYSALKSQLRPHFLFNSLHSLAQLIRENAESGSVMAEKLSDLYREILANSKSPLSSLSSEVSIVRKYLELEKVRFEERIAFAIEVPGESDEIMMPSLLLQPLVENAVKHGVAQSLEGGEIRLEVRGNSEGGYFFKLTNTGPPFHAKAVRGTGLTNTIARLRLYAGDRSRFEIAPLGDRGTIVSFHIPGKPKRTGPKILTGNG